MRPACDDEMKQYTFSPVSSKEGTLHRRAAGFDVPLIRARAEDAGWKAHKAITPRVIGASHFSYPPALLRSYRCCLTRIALAGSIGIKCCPWRDHC